MNPNIGLIGAMVQDLSKPLLGGIRSICINQPAGRCPQRVALFLWWHRDRIKAFDRGIDVSRLGIDFGSQEQRFDVVRVGLQNRVQFTFGFDRVRVV